MEEMLLTIKTSIIIKNAEYRFFVSNLKNVGNSMVDNFKIENNILFYSQNIKQQSLSELIDLLLEEIKIKFINPDLSLQDAISAIDVFSGNINKFNSKNPLGLISFLVKEFESIIKNTEIDNKIKEEYADNYLGFILNNYSVEHNTLNLRLLLTNQTLCNGIVWRDIPSMKKLSEKYGKYLRN
jgi:hypothetical protein